MSNAMESIAADMIPVGKVTGDGVLRGVYWNSVMKSRIKHCHHRNTGIQHGFCGSDGAKSRLVVQRSQVTERVDGRNDVVIQARWLSKAVPPMDHAMADGVQAAGRQETSPGQPRKYTPGRLVMVGNGHGVLVGSVVSHTIHARLATNMFYHPMCQAVL